MLGWRIGISCILVPALLGLFYWDHQLGINAPVLLVLCLGLAIRAAAEMSILLKTRSMQPSFPLIGASCAVIVASNWLPPLTMTLSPPMILHMSLSLVGFGIIASFVASMLKEAVVYRDPGQSMESLGANSLSTLYVGGLLSTLIILRWFPHYSMGYYVIGSVIICVKSGDTMAYTLGRLFGKRKMVPTLSPGKTWAGGFGALLGSGLGGWLWLQYGHRLFDAEISTNLASILCYSVALGAIGLVGDLCESLIKRDCEKKDSAQLMPGFGGLLDLLDSPLFAGPFALAWWAIWPPASL